MISDSYIIVDYSLSTPLAEGAPHQSQSYSTRDDRTCTVIGALVSTIIQSLQETKNDDINKDEVIHKLRCLSISTIQYLDAQMHIACIISDLKSNSLQGIESFGASSEYKQAYEKIITQAAWIKKVKDTLDLEDVEEKIRLEDELCFDITSMTPELFRNKIESISNSIPYFQTAEGHIRVLDLCTFFTDTNPFLDSCALLQEQLEKVEDSGLKVHAHLVLMKCYFANKKLFEAKKQYEHIVTIILNQRKAIHKEPTELKSKLLNFQVEMLKVIKATYNEGLQYFLNG